MNDNSLFDINNYNSELTINPNKIITKYMEIMNEYLFHAGENIKVIRSHRYYVFILKRGLNTIKHIFNTILLYTKNLDLTIHHCKKAYLYYVEFIGQIGDTNHSYLQLNSKDATLFVYKKTIFEINNEYRKTFHINDNEKLIFNYICCSTKLYNELILFILDNENLKHETRMSYIMYIQKMVKKILSKFLLLAIPFKKKIEICETYLYYKNLLYSKHVTDECKFLNLTNIFFKKLLQNKKITIDAINSKMYSAICEEKLSTMTTLKFTNWLFDGK